YRIKIWERTNLEELIIGKDKLAKKYNLPSEMGYLTAIHPIHSAYLQASSSIKLRDFFDMINNLDSKLKRDVLSTAYRAIMKPKYREVVKVERNRVEFVLDEEISFEDFRSKCDNLSQMIDESFLVNSMVLYILDRFFASSDITSIDAKTR